MMMKGFEWYRTLEPAGPDRMSRAGDWLRPGEGLVRSFLGDLKIAQTLQGSIALLAARVTLADQAIAMVPSANRR